MSSRDAAPAVDGAWIDVVMRAPWGAAIVRGEEMVVAAANEAYARLHGTSASAIVGRRLRDLHTPLQQARIEAAMREAAARGGATYEDEHGDPAGGARVVLVTVARNDDSPRWVIIYQDVTEREALRARERDLAEAQRIAHVGSWEWDVVRDVITWSDEVYRIFGHPVGAFRPTYERFVEMIHPDDRARVTGTVDAAIRERRHYDVEHRVLRPDGTLRVVQERGEVVYAGERPVRMVGTVHDITELRDAEEARRVAREREMEVKRLEELARFKTGLLNTAAHELATPLTPITFQLAILRTPSFGALTEPQRESIEVLERSIERLRRLIEDLLDAARLQSGRLKHAPEDIDLQSCVAEASRAFSQVASEAHVALRREGDEPLAVHADPARIGQVLTNLLSNALKFTPAGGNVTLSARREGGEAVVRVQDSGIGIDPEKLPLLFQPFTQVHDVAIKKGGTGLGLYVSRGIVEQHGGRIGALSEGRGKGATFWFALPLRP